MQLTRQAAASTPESCPSLLASASQRWFCCPSTVWSHRELKETWKCVGAFPQLQLFNTNSTGIHAPGSPAARNSRQVGRMQSCPSSLVTPGNSLLSKGHFKKRGDQSTERRLPFKCERAVPLTVLWAACATLILFPCLIYCSALCSPSLMLPALSAALPSALSAPVLLLPSPICHKPHTAVAHATCGGLGDAYTQCNGHCQHLWTLASAPDADREGKK